jgi:hypothetical protein
MLAVTSAIDDPNLPGTLRYEVAQAQSGDTIFITPALHGAPVVLTQGEFVLDKDLTIAAQQNHPATISGNSTSRVFEVASGAHVTLDNLSITAGNGVGAYQGEGGGILNFGTLTVSSSTLSDNSAGSGGRGGGIANTGILMVSGSTLSDNSAGSGGAIYNFNFAALTVSDSTLSGNSAAVGGRILNLGTVTVSGSTLSGNSAAHGGAIYNFGTVTVSGSILSGNSATQGGIYNDSGTLTVGDSSFCQNTPDDIFGPYTDEGGNTFC